MTRWKISYEDGMTSILTHDEAREAMRNVFNCLDDEPRTMTDGFNEIEPGDGHIFDVYAIPKCAADDMTMGEGILTRTFTGEVKWEVEYEADDWVYRNSSPDNPDWYAVRPRVDS